MVFIFSEKEFAWLWAEKKHRKLPAVIEATIVLGYCLDIDNYTKFGELLNSAFRQIELEHGANGKPLPVDVGERRPMTSLLINCAAENTWPETETVKGTSGIGASFPGCSFNVNRKTQICVRNPKNILHPRQIFKEIR